MPAVTDNAKLSLLTYNQTGQAAVPAPTGAAMDQGDKQHIIWQYAGILWAAAAAIPSSTLTKTIRRRVFRPARLRSAPEINI